MKLSKSDLKAIVKECLVELLSEGLGGISPTTAAPFPRSQNAVTSALSDSLKRQPVPRPTPHLREAIRREAGGDKVMESILADTAASTLPKFLQAGDGKSPMPVVGGGIVEQVVAQANPEDLFGDDVASKWASLAFMESPTKK
jgi:hypothetical protein